MANVNIKFNGKEFLLCCDDGQEEHLEELSIYLNEKFTKLKNKKPRHRRGLFDLERETRFELATPTLARLCSTN